MPPKKTQNTTTTTPPIPQRRSRTESLKEDLFRLLNEEEEKSDEFFYVVLKEAIEEGVFVDLELCEKKMLFSFFAARGMMKCFEEMYCICVTNFNFYDMSTLLHVACASSGSDEDALRMARLLLVQIGKFQSSDERYWFAAIAATVQYARLPVARALLAKWNEVSVPQKKSDKDETMINTLATVLLKEGVQQASVEAVRLALQSSCELPVEASLVVKAATLTASTILELLLDAGADVESKNEAGETPLLAAVRSGSLANVKLLIRTKECTGSSLDVQSAALNAIEYRRAEIVKELVDACGIVVSSRSLRACVAVDDFDCFKILLNEMKPHPGEVNAVLICLVSHQQYDMLSFVLFECPNTAEAMKINDFERLLKKATNDDIKSLLRKKIDIMNGKGESHVKVKEEQI